MSFLLAYLIVGLTQVLLVFDNYFMARVYHHFNCSATLSTC